VVDKSLDEEDEIIVQLSNETINVVAGRSIFVVVKRPSGKDTDKFQDQGHVGNIKKLDSVVDRE